MATIRGCSLRKSALQNIGSSWTALTWDTEDIDSDGFHEGVTNPSRITIPATIGGVARAQLVVQLMGGARWSNSIGGTYRALRITKNGLATYPGCAGITGIHTVSNFPTYCVGGPPLMVVPGDYFELEAHAGTGSQDVETHVRTFFALTVKAIPA